MARRTPKSAPARTIVWVVDDVDENHDLVRRSLPERHEQACELTGYLSVRETTEALTVLLEGNGRELPDVIFMDYYLDDGNGEELTRAIRRAFEERGLRGPLIVGHSSARGCSQRIVGAGGDLAIDKAHYQVSPGVQRLFPNLAALRSHAGRSRRSARDTQ